MTARVAIVGAGIAGLACAGALRERGVDVTVYDKGRRPGGRLASHDSVALDVDLGAQYFTVRDARFRRAVSAWIDEGVVAPWNARVRALPKPGAPLADTPAIERFVGTPSMLSIAAHLARDVRIHASHRVDALERRGARYSLAGAVGDCGVTLGPRDPDDASPLTPFGEFDVLVVCLPSDQTHTLVRRVSPPLAAAAARVPSEPCLALGFVPEGDVLRGLDFDGLFVGRDGDPARILAWLARDSSKPKRRAGAESWLVHAAPEWSRAHLRAPRELVEAELLREVARLLGTSPLRARASTLRRWAFARPIAPLTEEALFDAGARIGIGGDWSAGGRVEGAFLAGLALARHVLRLEPSA